MTLQSTIAGCSVDLLREMHTECQEYSLSIVVCSAYVIMNAGATEISSGAIGLVYFCGVFPSLLVKSTGPYWCVLGSAMPTPEQAYEICLETVQWHDISAFLDANRTCK